jgi:hypothetical protein
VTLTQKGRLAVIEHRVRRLRARATAKPLSNLELLGKQMSSLRDAIARKHGDEAARMADRLAELAAQARDLDHQAERELAAKAWL